MNENVCRHCRLPGHWTRNCPGIPVRPQDRLAEPAGAVAPVDALRSVPQTARDAAVQAVKDHPSTTFMAPYESLADAVLDASVPIIREEVRRECAVSLLTDTERAMLRYAIGCAREDMDDRADEFSDDDAAALESLRRLASEAPAEPAYIEDREYQVVGDWGVDGADSEDEARADVAKALWVHPACGAYAEQRIVRTWPDGSEFYGPWTRLPESG